MSRKPSSSVPKTAMARTVSAATLSMPPPSKIPNRPASALTSSATGNGLAKLVNVDDGASGPVSPRKSSYKKPTTVNSSVPSKGVTSAGENGEINIQVVVRCRGRSPQELASASPVITTSTGPLSKAITIETTPSTSMLGSFTTASSYGGNGPTTKTYPFDKVFGPEADQTMVFREVAEGMLDEVLAGYNCTIFAYGQTGTGKTFTMQGDLELSPLSAPKTEAGIVPRVLHRLFQLLESAQNTEYTVRCSYVELYNEELRDLLSADYHPVAAGEKQPMALAQGGNGNGGAGLKLYEDGKKGVMIQGLEEIGVRGLKDALNLLNRGCQRRQVAETKMNTESSRSHTIFTVTVHIKEATLASGGDDLLRIGKFNLVDLAGSEAIGRSGATDKRAREAGMINQSLLTLGRVISALTEKSSHIPYRESKLTRLLQDSLGGRTKTCIVATVSPTRSNMEETLSTLDYAIRAKSIRNRPEVNAHLTKSGVLKEYLGDIERLKAEVMAAREKNGVYIPEDQWREMHEQQSKMKSEFEEAKLRASAATVELETRRKEFEELTEQFLLTTEELAVTKEAERQLGVLIEETKAELEVVQTRLDEERWVSKQYEGGEERVDGVAKELRGVAQESVADVGGLFEKLARKAKILGANADSATTFGTEISTISTDLRAGLDKLHSVQTRFGEEMQKGLESYTKHAQKHAKKDLAALDASLASFNALSTKLTESISAGKLDAEETGRELQIVKEEVQNSVRTWATQVGERSEGMVKDLMQHQQQHLTMISSVLTSTSDLFDSIITASKAHLSAEQAAAQRSKTHAESAASTEISRLRAQNVLLAKLLTEEKAKTAHLRTELVGNLTNLIVGFTDAQDASWSQVVSQVQAANEQGVAEMTDFSQSVSEAHAESSTRVNGFAQELDEAMKGGARQRKQGNKATKEVEEGMSRRLAEYGAKTKAELESQVVVVDGFCERLGETSAQAASRAETRAMEQSAKLTDISMSYSASNEAARAKASKHAEDTTAFADGLLAAHTSSSKSYNKHHAVTSSKIDSILGSTAAFLESGISEDVPTGITPKKKVWSVQTSWERTQPRQILLETYRQKKANGELGVEGEYTTTAETATVPSEATVQGAMDEVRSVASSENLHDRAEVQQPESASEQVSRIPSLKPSSKGKSALSQSVSGKKGHVAVEEKVALPPLGEAGQNLPRRTRR